MTKKPKLTAGTEVTFRGKKYGAFTLSFVQALKALGSERRTLSPNFFKFVRYRIERAEEQLRLKYYDPIGDGVEMGSISVLSGTMAHLVVPLLANRTNKDKFRLLQRKLRSLGRALFRRYQKEAPHALHPPKTTKKAGRADKSARPGNRRRKSR